MRVYERPGDGLADAMRLSEAMTAKMAVANTERGGGKAVLAVPELPAGEARRALLLRYGKLVASLGGTYRTAGDMNIAPEDLDVVHEVCPWVYGTTAAGGSSGRGTARGVLHGIRASVEHVFGSPDLAGRTVLVQGAGAVGHDLARDLLTEGATVLVADVDEERAASTGARAVAVGDAVTTECDVYAPCAVGGTLNAETIPRLRCRIVAGSANNQLATAEDAARLHDAGILYAPDYVVNAGGVIQLIGLEDRHWSESELEAHLAGVGDTLRRIYADADAAGITPAEAAERLAAERIAQKQDRAPA
jgi:glutamate dehydrogenase/leucine dehydrogenase